MHRVPTAHLSASAASDGRPWGLLALFTALHIINHIDRHLVASFAPQIMADLNLSRSAFALIAGVAFSLFYALNALGAGLLADRIGRVRVLTAGAGLWSISTAACGLAIGFWSLLALRPIVAAGEATLVPTATNILLARSSARARATMMGIFFIGIPLGAGGSYLVAATLGPMIGWRKSFVLMGLVGLFATLAVARVRDVSPTAAEPAAHKQPRLIDWWRAICGDRRLFFASLALILFHAHMATAAFTQLWLVGDKGLSPGYAARLYGLMFIGMGIVGAAGAGLFTDALYRRWRIDHAKSLAWVMLALAPLLPLYRMAPGGSAWMFVGMAASIFYTTAAYGPCFSIIEKALPDTLKATATGMNMLLINIVMIGGLGLAIGLVSDVLAAHAVANSWTWPLFGADMIAMLGGLALLAAGRTKPT